MRHGFINQKLGKTNSRRGQLLKGKNFSQPSARPPKSSKNLAPGGPHHGSS